MVLFGRLNKPVTAINIYTIYKCYIVTKQCILTSVIFDKEPVTPSYNYWLISNV